MGITELTPTIVNEFIKKIVVHAPEKIDGKRFQKVDIKEPSLDECVDILKGLQPHYEKHHNVRYSSSSLRAAVELSARHVQDRLLPDKAIDVMDEAGASVRLRPGFKSGSSVSRQDVERIVARIGQGTRPPEDAQG